MKKKNEIKFVIGIDEVGRGALAGPVSVCAVRFPVSKFRAIRRELAGIRDSKKLSAAARSDFSNKIKKLKRDGTLEFAVNYISADVIDRQGIARAISRALRSALYRVSKDIKKVDIEVLLDGGLYAPNSFPYQRTLIHGDDTELPISIASVFAKHRRDQMMIRLGKQYPIYNFGQNKGYGTLAHRRVIRRRGISPIHRRSFCSDATA